ncbi:MAG: DsrE family protein [Promethearchaeota archaeon]
MTNEMRYCIFAFRGDLMCFSHVLLNALHMRSMDYDVKIVIEGEATKLIKTFHDDPKTPFYGLYKKVKESDMISAVCQACATKMGSFEAAEAERLPIVGDMNGHPSMTTYIEEGYKIITF